MFGTLILKSAKFSERITASVTISRIKKDQALFRFVISCFEDVEYPSFSSVGGIPSRYEGYLKTKPVAIRPSGSSRRLRVMVSTRILPAESDASHLGTL